MSAKKKILIKIKTKCNSKQEIYSINNHKICNLMEIINIKKQIILTTYIVKEINNKNMDNRINMI